MTLRLAGVIALAAALAGCARSVPPPPDPPGAPMAASVYVIERGWHTDIGMPVAALTGPLQSLRPATGVRFLVFGFGDRDYLKSRDENVGAMLGALLPDRALLLVTALEAPPDQAFPTVPVTALPVTQGEFDRIETFLWEALAKDADGGVRSVGDGPYPDSLFYDATSSYAGFYTCNTWTAEALQAAGLPAHAGGILFSGQVMDQVRGIAASRAGK